MSEDLPCSSIRVHQGLQWRLEVISTLALVNPSDNLHPLRLSRSFEHFSLKTICPWDLAAAKWVFLRFEFKCAHWKVNWQGAEVSGRRRRIVYEWWLAARYSKPVQQGPQKCHDHSSIYGGWQDHGRFAAELAECIEESQRQKDSAWIRRGWWVYVVYDIEKRCFQ